MFGGFCYGNIFFPTPFFKITLEIFCGLWYNIYYKRKDWTVNGIEAKISLHNKDIISKYTSGLFKNAILDYYGIKSTAKIKDLINVEFQVIEVSEARADFILLMDDDTYKHLEFQTTYSGKDLTRFSRYDSLLYDRDGRKVDTIIIYSSDVRKIDESLDIGTLKYQPTNIMMSEFDGDSIYKDLEIKLKEKQELTDIDMLNLIFLPLMKNSIPKAELALKSVELAKTIGDRSKRETCIVSAIVFTSKYLSGNEINRIWEVAKVTDIIGRLIQQEVDKEVKIAVEVHNKLKEYRVKTAIKLIKKGLSVEDIADSTSLDIEFIKELKEEIGPLN